MDFHGKTVGMVTPTKQHESNRSKISEISRNSENFDPNVTSPGPKISRSPVLKSASKAQKSASKNPNSGANPVTSPSPKKKIRERRFVVAKKKRANNSTTVACKCCKNTGGKCLCVAYETLRASQEEFFKNKPSFNQEDKEFEKLIEDNGAGYEEQEEKNDTEAIIRNQDGYNVLKDKNRFDDNVEEELREIGVSTTKRTRDRLLEEARQSVPDSGSGRVMHLVKAFEKLLSIPKSNDAEEKDEEEETVQDDNKKVTKWALPGLQPPGALDTQISSSSFCPSDFFLTSESLGLDSRRSSSLDSSHGSVSSRTSGGGRRSRRNSAESAATFARRQGKRRQPKTTSLKPFNLRTEQRGRYKQEEFVKKLKQLMEEEARQRIPIAQGLPWTTDEPECLAKPLTKDITRPVDLVLHSDVRALERAEFDHQVAEKMSLIEQYKMERERLQKMEEEEEIRRLRRELVPKAQPMPYFDRPFIPRRSEKQPTIPKDPKFHIPQHKKIKCCTSWNELYSHEAQCGN